MIALLRFHLASGARVALAAAVPLAGMAVVGVGVQENPARVVEHAAASIAGARPSVFAIALLWSAALGLASWAVPRVALGSDGWIRHLPSSRTQHRIALILATSCAELPLVAAALGGAALVSWRTGEIAWPGFVLPPIMAVATAALAVTLRPRKRRGWPLRLTGGAPFEVRIAVRALGARLVTGWVSGAIPVGAAFLFVRNNALPAHLASGAVRLGGSIAVTFALADCADALAIRRPSWPWARSLPVSAARRVVGDAAMIGLLCVPIIVATAAIDPGAAGVVAALIPLLALRAAAAMRRGGNSLTAAWGPVLIEGAFAGGLIALAPWLALAAMAAIPLALRSAIERDRALKVTQWSALHFISAGDTHSWTV